MKKALIGLLILVLFLTGFFFWKGYHHAIYLSGVMEDWLDTDHADQTITIQVRNSDLTFSANGRIESVGNQWTMSTDSFWTEYADERVYGLTMEGVTVYLSGKNLYMDTGKAYALPEVPELKQSLSRLPLGFFLYGRVTKKGDTYHISMNTDELDLDASVTVDQTIRSVTVKAVLPDKTVINATLTSEQAQPHLIPEPVTDAMTLARTEPPMPLTELMDVLLPVAEELLPLSGELNLCVSCGILELSETMQLDVQKNKAVLTQNGKTLELPMDLSALSPTTMAVVLLREAEYAKTDTGALFAVKLPADASTALMEAMVPEAADLGINLRDSSIYLWVSEDRLTSARLIAKGSVPFLLTSIPVDFSASLTIS